MNTGLNFYRKISKYPKLLFLEFCYLQDFIVNSVLFVIINMCKTVYRWKHAAEKIMEIQSPGSTRHSFTRQLRGGSLYDETPLIGMINGSN